MDLESIKQGNFSSISGTWRRARDGSTLVFDNQGLTDQSLELSISIVDGNVIGSLKQNDSMTGGSIVVFLPAGVSHPYATNEAPDKSDQTKERIWSGNGIAYDDSDFYYKVGN
ncbi:UNVERIFIED_CONTAM: hypothetical protein KB579_01580 [Streptococcus canis]|uniref:DUF6287 domain-containing protein n=2 Tax=Streptococcus canis TaxID=1329 RepID=A0A3P5XWI7_STRCB|nr:hypothetical protein GE021_008235 [Streptococcus canis]VDC41732.1 hypothetical protein FMV2238Y02_01930 [Streptococcus canis]